MHLRLHLYVLKIFSHLLKYLNEIFLLLLFQQKDLVIVVYLLFLPLFFLKFENLSCNHVVLFGELLLNVSRYFVLLRLIYQLYLTTICWSLLLQLAINIQIMNEKHTSSNANVISVGSCDDVIDSASFNW